MSRASRGYDAESGTSTAYNQSSRTRGEYIALGVVCALVVLLAPSLMSSKNDTAVDRSGIVSSHIVEFASPQQRQSAEGGMYDFAIVADLDKKSRVESEKALTWSSILLKGTLRHDKVTDTWEVVWKEPMTVSSQHGEAWRGMELSELVWFQDSLLTFDDRSGIVYAVDPSIPAVYPRHILMEGSGDTSKGMKCEWATTKGGHLFVGSFGKEYTNSDGTVANYNNLWVVEIDANGRKIHHNWSDRYNKLREAAGCKFPGYMIHEAAVWSEYRNKWVFLPRRVSPEPYDEVADEKRGSNKALIVSEDFSQIDVKEVTPLTPVRGFSTFKFLPGSRDRIVVALKSMEEEETDRQNTFITVFELDSGKVLLEEVAVPGEKKFEGLEFLR